MKKTLVFLLSLYALMELTAYLSLVVLKSRSGVSIVYNNEILDNDIYISRYNHLLGWPSPKAFGKRVYAADGSRQVPDNQGQALISAFGDSFVFCAEVKPEESWPYLLSTEIKSDVKNFGVNGYGTDQAFLRHQNLKENFPIEILGFTSDNIMRNANQYRNLLSGKLNSVGLKPRFILNDGKLQPILIPEKALHNLEALQDNPTDFLEHEYFLPGTNGPVVSSWSWIVSLVKCFSHYSIKSKIAGEPFYKEFFEKDHASQALQITAQLLSNFYLDGEKDGNTRLIILFPQIQDFQYYKTTGFWMSDSLKLILKQNGVSFIDLGESMIKADVLDDLDSYFAPQGHYNRKGNILVSQILKKEIMPHIISISQ